MTTDANGNGARFWVRWLKASFLGWFLGFIFMIALLPVGNLLGGESQFMIGTGFGAGVGLVQARLLKARLESPWRWWAASAGMGIPFVVSDLARLLGFASFYSLPICVVAGGLIVSLTQWWLLRSVSGEAGWWIPACLAGWGLPVAVLSLGGPGGRLPEPWSTLFTLLGILFGGALLGVVSGPAMARVLRGGEA